MARNSSDMSLIRNLRTKLLLNNDTSNFLPVHGVPLLLELNIFPRRQGESL